MDNNHIIWAAGFLDGEGTITIKRYKYKKTDKLYYLPMISCAQTIRGRKGIERLKELFGGSIYEYRQAGNRIDTVMWSVASRDAELCVNQILPYLFLKNEQAKIVLEFFKDKPKWSKEKLTDEVCEQRKDLFERMRVFNVKGKLRLQRLNEETAKAEATV